MKAARYAALLLLCGGFFVAVAAWAATLFSDDFNRGSLGTTNWDQTQNGSTWSISSNELDSGTLDGESGGGWLYTTTSAHAATADMKVSVDIGSSTFDGGPIVRATDMTDNAEDLYYGDAWNDGGTKKVQIYLRDFAGDSLVSGANFSWSDGDTLRLEIEGSALRLYVNGSLKTSGTDSTHSGSGRSGVMSWDTSNLYDNFLAEDFAAGGAERRVVMIAQRGR